MMSQNPVSAFAKEAHLLLEVLWNIQFSNSEGTTYKTSFKEVVQLVSTNKSLKETPAPLPAEI